MTLKCDSKFKGKLTHGLKNDKENLVNFHASCRKCQNLHFNGLLLCNVYKVTKVWKKTDSWFQKWHEEFGEFYCEKTARWCATFVGSILYLSQKKYRGVMCRNTEEWCKIWGGADSVLWKMAWGIWGLLTQH